jgi:hypothetical protein
VIESITLPAAVLAWWFLLEYYDNFQLALDFPLTRLSSLVPTSAGLASLAAALLLPAYLTPASLVVQLSNKSSASEKSYCKELVAW